MRKTASFEQLVSFEGEDQGPDDFIAELDLGRSELNSDRRFARNQSRTQNLTAIDELAVKRVAPASEV